MCLYFPILFTSFNLRGYRRLIEDEFKRKYVTKYIKINKDLSPLENRQIFPVPNFHWFRKLLKESSATIGSTWGSLFLPLWLMSPVASLTAMQVSQSAFLPCFLSESSSFYPKKGGSIKNVSQYCVTSVKIGAHDLCMIRTIRINFLLEMSIHLSWRMHLLFLFNNMHMIRTSCLFHVKHRDYLHPVCFKLSIS